jgi:HTH-type transcriptional regulator / antitoxin HigA
MTDKALEYDPSLVYPHGETLLELLEERSLPLSQLAQLSGIGETVLVQIARGSLPITDDIARGLELGTQVPASFWLNLERGYREYLQRAERIPA